VNKKPIHKTPKISAPSRTNS